MRGAPPRKLGGMSRCAEEKSPSEMAAPRPQHGLRTTARPIYCCTTLAALVIAANFYFSLPHKPVGVPAHRRRAAATANASTLRAELRAVLPVADAGRSAPPVRFDGLFAREEPIDEAVAAEDLTCAGYSGPMYFPYGGRYKVRRRTVRAARIDGHGGIFGTGGSIAPTPLALIPFSLHDVRLLAPSRFALGFATNLAYLRHLDSDRLLYFFRKVARLPQPRPKVFTSCLHYIMRSSACDEACDHIMPSERTREPRPKVPRYHVITSCLHHAVVAGGAIRRMGERRIGIARRVRRPLHHGPGDGRRCDG